MLFITCSRVAIAELSKTPTSFFGARSRESPGFQSRQATLGVVDGGFGQGLQHPTCSVWADSARYPSIGVVNEQLPSIWGGDSKLAIGDGEEISTTVTTPAYRKVAGVKPYHSYTTAGGYGVTFTF